MQTTLMECEIGIVDKFWELRLSQHSMIVDGRDAGENSQTLPHYAETLSLKGMCNWGYIAQGGMMVVMQETQ